MVGRREKGATIYLHDIGRIVELTGAKVKDLCEWWTQMDIHRGKGPGIAIESISSLPTSECT